RAGDALVVGRDPDFARAGGKRAPGHVQDQRLAAQQPQRLAGQPRGVMAGGNGDDEIWQVHAAILLGTARRPEVPMPVGRNPVERAWPRSDLTWERALPRPKGPRQRLWPRSGAAVDAAATAVRRASCCRASAPAVPAAPPRTPRAAARRCPRWTSAPLRTART